MFLVKLFGTTEKERPCSSQCLGHISRGSAFLVEVVFNTKDGFHYLASLCQHNLSCLMRALQTIQMYDLRNYIRGVRRVGPLFSLSIHHSFPELESDTGT